MGAHSSGSAGTMQLSEGSAPALSVPACPESHDEGRTAANAERRSELQHLVVSWRTRLSVTKACENPHGNQCPILPTNSDLFSGITSKAARMVAVLQFRLGKDLQVYCNLALGARFRGLRNGAALANLCAGWLSSSHRGREKKNRR